MHRFESITFLLMISMIVFIGKSHGDAEGRMVLADNNPLIRSANFYRNSGATGRNICVIGLAPPTSISQISPRAAGRSALFFLMSKFRFFQINCLIYSFSLSRDTPGSTTGMSLIVTSTMGVTNLVKTAICLSTSSAYS